jgi:N-acetylglutamate synthase-like GNAT family acetyltransferase
MMTHKDDKDDKDDKKHISLKTSSNCDGQKIMKLNTKPDPIKTERFLITAFRPKGILTIGTDNYFTMEQDGQVIAAVMFKCHNHSSKNPKSDDIGQLHIKGFAVAPEFRQTYCGFDLLIALLEHAKEKNIRTLYFSGSKQTNVALQKYQWFAAKKVLTKTDLPYCNPFFSASVDTTLNFAKRIRSFKSRMQCNDCTP